MPYLCVTGHPRRWRIRKELGKAALIYVASRLNFFGEKGALPHGLGLFPAPTDGRSEGGASIAL